MTVRELNAVRSEPKADGDGEFERLLAPIEGETPTGENLRYDPVYDRIQEMRREEDPNEPQGIWAAEVKRADWAGVRREISEVLATRSKDLQLAVWLVDAMLADEGLSTLPGGIGLLCDLCERYWPDLHPAIEDGDLDARLAPLFWLDEKLVQRIAVLPMTVAKGGDGRSYSWQDWVNAQRLEPMASAKPKEYEKMVQGGAVTVASFSAAVKGGPDSFYQQLYAHLTASEESLRRLRTLLDEFCGRDAPSMSRLQKTLGEIRQFTQRVLAERGKDPSARSAAPVVALEEAGKMPKKEGQRSKSTMPPPRDGTISSREEAYQLLEMVADYLMRTEPHSPTPYLVRRAASWGSKSLMDLLDELIEESGDRKRLARLLIGEQG
jgi:type VI secretion system ImpA family protein